MRIIIIVDKLHKMSLHVRENNWMKNVIIRKPVVADCIISQGSHVLINFLDSHEFERQLVGCKCRIHLSSDSTAEMLVKVVTFLDVDNTI